MIQADEPNGGVQQLGAPPDGLPDDPRVGSVRDQVQGAIRALVHDIDHRLAPGDVADLRRVGGGALAPAYWRLLLQHVEPAELLAAPADVARRSDQEEQWAVIMGAIAQSRGLHSNALLGQALAEADVSEMRVMRLLSASGAPLFDLVRTAMHQLASKGVAHDPLDVALLVLHQNSESFHGRGEIVRRRIARSYYRTAQRKDAK